MTWIKRRAPIQRKYKNAKSTDEAGRSFDSGLERSVFRILELQQRAGEIKSIRQQASVYLTDARILYKPDFEVEAADGSTYFVEAKGFKTAVYAIKRRLWMHYGPGPLHVYEGSAANPKLTETIIPKENA